MLNFLPSVGKNQPAVIASNSKALASVEKTPIVTLEDLIFEHFEAGDKDMPILCESSNTALDFGSAEIEFDEQIAQPPSPSILDELVQAVYGTLSWVTNQKI